MDPARQLRQLRPTQYPGLPEIATRAKDITRPWVAELDLPDDITLRDSSYDWSIYDGLLRDDQVFSTLQQRRLAVVSREYEVVPGGSRRIDRAAADFISEVIAEPSLTNVVPQQINGQSLVAFDQLTNAMLYGRFWGFAVAELLYARDGRFIYPEQIKVRKQRRFRFDPEGRLRMLTWRDPFGEKVQELYPKKFWLFQCGGENDDDPYRGNGLAPVIYWPVWFKRNGLKFWSIYLETHSKPRIAGKHAPNATDDEVTKLLAVVEAVQEGAGVTIPEGMVLELMQATARADSYEQFASYWDRAIAKVILGQTSTSEAVGGQYKSEVQMEVRAELIKADADLVNGSANLTWVRWLSEWNFPGAAAPKIWRRLQDEPDLKPQAERDRVLFEMGYQPTEEYVQGTYGDGFERVEQPQLVSLSDPLPQPEPAEEFAADPNATLPPTDYARRSAGQMATTLGPLVDGWTDQIQALLERSRSLEEFGEALAELYPELDKTQFAEQFRDGLLAVQLGGAAEVAAEGGDIDADG